MAELVPVPDRTPATGWKKDAAALVLLVLLVLPLRLWLLTSTEVASRDGIGYIRYALQFEHFTWDQVLRKHDQHPGYSLAVLAVSWPVRLVNGETTAETMQFTAQLTGMIAAFLLLYPMYQLGRLFFNRRLGFCAALLYQYLPISAHHLSDGISETLFLLLVATALLQAVHALQSRSIVRHGLCGVSVAMAYLTRPEGGFIGVAAVLVLAGMQVRPAVRMTWRRFFLCSALLTTLSIGVGFDLTVGSGRLPKESVRVFLRLFGIEPQDLLPPQIPGSVHRRAVPRQGPGDGGRGPLFAITFHKSDDLKIRTAQSGRALAQEVANGFHYVGVVPALLGLFWSFRRLRSQPGFWVMAVYCAIQAATLIMLAMTAGYVSDRHTMTLVMCGSFFVVAGFFELPGRVLSLIGITRPPTGLGSPHRAATVGGLLLFAAMLAFCLPKTLLPLHADRAGNHAAGLWLKDRLHDGDEVDDDHCWSHFYAGMVFKEDRPVPPSPGLVPRTYVVITRSRDSEVNAARREKEERAVKAGGEEVFHWPQDGSLETARVVVYVVPRANWKH